MAVHGQTVRAGKAGRPRTHDGNALAGGRRAREGLATMLHLPVGGMALEHADTDGLAFLTRIVHAFLLTQDLGGADTGAGTAQDVGFKDDPGRTRHVVRRYGADETRDVDARGAGLDAWRIVAVETAISFNHGLGMCERRVSIGKIKRKLGIGKTTGRYIGTLRHDSSNNFLME
ncbi:hypothetical protein SXCC_02407 [Gluconacetobacter sp. SXCC-1]|nr:hypothetical protein SXCC_02407 [Gluconacetobacter sp. SXCC-1]